MPKQTKVKKSATTKKPGPISQAKTRTTDVKAQQPHKTFQLTRRRDLPKRQRLPGYIGFIKTVFRTIWTYWTHFLILLALYVGIATLFIGLVQQDQYQLISSSVKEFGPLLAGGELDTISQAIGLFGVTISGGLNTSLDGTQQLFLGVVYVTMWLVLVWLLRQLLAGNVVKVRDGLYNGAAPFISTMLIGLLMIAQSIPAAIGALIFSIAIQGAVVEGVGAILFGLGALLLLLLSLYWLTSSVFALLIVTLPGTYPMTAIRSASEIVLGRRLQLMIRLLWLGLVLLLTWTIILIPVLLIEGWLNASWLLLVPVTVQILTGFSILFATTYIYLLYRGMIDESASE